MTTEGRRAEMPQDTAPESGTEARPGLDRRDMIKKTVIAGGLVWAAPTVLASTASAADAGGCTPKCGPTNNGTFSGIINTIGCELQGFFPGGSWHPAFFEVGPIVNAGSGCGCGGAPEITIEGGQTFHIEDDDWDHGTGVGQHVGYVGNHPDHPDYPRPGAALFAVIRCTDRQGRGICRRCELIGSFNWTWTVAGTLNGQAACVASPANGPFTVQYQIINCEDEGCCD